MTDVPRPPPAGQETVRPALDWTDPVARAAWVADLRARAGDVIAVAEDQTAPLAQRRLGRAAAVELLGDACHSLDALFAYACPPA